MGRLESASSRLEPPEFQHLTNQRASPACPVGSDRLWIDRETMLQADRHRFARMKWEIHPSIHPSSEAALLRGLGEELSQAKLLTSEVTISINMRTSPYRICSLDGAGLCVGHGLIDPSRET